MRSLTKIKHGRQGLIQCTAFFLALILSWSCATTGKLKLDPELQEFVEKYQVLMTRAEWKEFRGLREKKDQLDFVNNFWLARNPNPLAADNAFKLEIEKRVEFTEKYFREPGNSGWNTDRGRIFILLGQPDEVFNNPMTNDPQIKSISYWLYNRYRLQITFIDRDGSGRMQLATYATGLAIAQEMARDEHLQKSAGFEPLRFSAAVDKERRLLITVNPADLLFNEQGQELVCRLRFKVSGKKAHPEIPEQESERELRLEISQLAEKTGPLEIETGIYLPIGRNHLEITLTDLLADRSQSRDFRLRVR